MQLKVSLSLFPLEAGPKLIFIGRAYSHSRFDVIDFRTWQIRLLVVR